MRKRKLLGVLAVAVALVVYLLVPSPSRVSDGNFERIQQGMRRAEVEAILGMPGDYRTGPTNHGNAQRLPADEKKEEAEQLGENTWAGNAGVIHVIYDSSERVQEKTYRPLHRLEPDLFGDWLWRVRRQWRLWFG